MEGLRIEGLKVKLEGKLILRGVDLEARSGEVTALMGPNGSGKSTLAQVVMGNPAYEVVSGRVTYNGEDLLVLKPEERARKGLFLSFQHPPPITGLTLLNLLRTALASKRESPDLISFKKLVEEKARLVGLGEEFLSRPLNQGFSGGELKKAEVLQLAVLKPTLAVLDETDSGLDIDSLKRIAEGVKQVMKENPSMGVLLITHYQRILRYLQPSTVYVMIDGRIAAKGSEKLAHLLEEKGYSWLRSNRNLYKEGVE